MTLIQGTGCQGWRVLWVKGRTWTPFLAQSLPGNDCTFVFNPICLLFFSFISSGAQITTHLFQGSHIFFIFDPEFRHYLHQPALQYVGKRCALSRFWRKWSNLLNIGAELTSALSRSQHWVLSQCLTTVYHRFPACHYRYFNSYSRTEAIIWFVSI